MRISIYLSTICVLGVDQTFSLFKKSSIDKVGARQFGQRINREADDFGLKDTVLIQRYDNLVAIADYQMQLRINVECLCKILSEGISGMPAYLPIIKGKPVELPELLRQPPAVTPLCQHP